MIADEEGEWGVGNREWGCEITSLTPLPTPHSPLPFFVRNPLSVAQTDDDPDRVPEVIEHFTSGPGCQVIYLTEANGEIVVHFDIESASQRVCERIARISRCNTET